MVITLSLPKDVEIKVKKGDVINFSDPLYQVRANKEIKINVAEKLEIKPEEIFRYITKVIGEEVKKGELLAKKKGLLGAKKIYSDCDGVIKEINHKTGEILLMTALNKQKLVRANFKGVVEGIGKNQLKIGLEGGTEFSLKEVNQDGGGEVFYFKDESFFFRVTEEEIRNKIIIIEELKKHIEAKCEALGCAGFLFLKGELPQDLPAGKIKNVGDYQKICELKKKYVIFSKEDKKAIVYS